MEVGRPAEVLGDATPRLDLLVLGSRGYGPLRRVLLGSVSSRVTREAQCPLLVVPRGESEDEEDERRRVRRATGETAVGLVPLTRP